MPQHALRELIALAGLAVPETGQIRITGDDPVFPTPYRIAASGAAAIAAGGYAAAGLWRLGSGNRQAAAVHARAAAAALRSSRYLQVDGKTPDGPRDPLSGFYPVRGGRWVCIHCNFPHHRDAAMKVLGAPHEREAAMRASANWDGLELEDAIHAAGGRRRGAPPARNPAHRRCAAAAPAAWRAAAGRRARARSHARTRRTDLRPRTRRARRRSAQDQRAAPAGFRRL